MKQRQTLEESIERVVAMRESVKKVIEKIKQERLDAEKKKREPEE